MSFTSASDLLDHVSQDPVSPCKCPTFLLSRSQATVCMPSPFLPSPVIQKRWSYRYIPVKGYDRFRSESIIFNVYMIFISGFARDFVPKSHLCVWRMFSRQQARAVFERRVGSSIAALRGRVTCGGVSLFHFYSAAEFIRISSYALEDHNFSFALRFN